MGRSAGPKTRPLASLFLLLALAGFGEAQREDGAGIGGPSVTIVRPTTSPIAEDAVTVEGWVRDNKAGRSSVVLLRRARWEVLGTSLRGTLSYDASGHFLFTFRTPARLTGAYLWIRAENLDGQAATESVALHDGRGAGRIVLSSPADGEYYREVTRLAGRISGPLENVADVKWSLDGVGSTGTIELDLQGGFSTALDTARLRGPGVIRVTVTTQDGAVAERALTLRDGMSPPAITVTQPEGGLSYGELVVLQGTVDMIGGKPRLVWQVRDSELSGDLEPAEGGGFSLTIPAGDLRGNLTVDLFSRAPSGRGSTLSVPVRERVREMRITLDSPTDNTTYREEYEQGIAIAGRVTSANGGVPSPAWIGALRYEVSGASPASGDLAVDPATGGFLTLLSAAELRGAAAIRVVLRDAAGVQIERVVALADKPEAPAAPSLVLSSPSPGAAFKGSMRVEGLVADGRDQATAESRFRSLEWEILGTDRRGPIELGAAGSFATTVPTEGLTGSQILQVTVAHQSGGRATQTVQLRDDGVGPWLSISSPAEGDVYRDALTLTGVALDAADDPASAGEVAHVFYQLAKEPRTEVALDRRGAFGAEIPTVGLHGNQTLTVTAVDRNGHETTASVTLRDGTGRPLITLESPVEQSAYGAYLLIRGRVALSDGANVRQLEELELNVASSSYSLASAPYKAKLTADAGGRFEAAVPTADFEGPQKVTVSARARNGNTAQIAVGVVKGASDLPGFAAKAGDGSVVLSWPAVPLAVRYDLAVDPGRPTKRENVTSPFELRGLSNGTLYSFRLTAALSTGQQVSSAEERVIPLTPDTLKPKVSGEYRRVRVSWQGIPAAASYEVWRSVDGPEGSVRIAETAELAYLDQNVEYGREYYYRIKPAHEAQILSAAATAHTTAFPVDRFTVESTLPVVGGVRALAVDRSYAYLACGPQGLIIAEIRDPNAPRILSSAQVDDARDVTLATLADGKRYALVACGQRGLVVVDVSLPAEPGVVGNRTTTDPQAVEVISDRTSRVAYVADGDSGLKVIDLSAARKPERIASLQVGNLRALSLQRPYLYAAGASSIVIFDVSDPAAPRQMSETPVTDGRGIVSDLRGGSTYLYVACGEQGLQVFDATDPRSVVPAGTYRSRMALGVSASTHAYVADDRGGVAVVDMSDPYAPALFETIDLGVARDLALETTAEGRQFAFVASSGGLKIVQVMVQGRSLELGSYGTESRGYRIEVSRLGTQSVYACIAGHASGVRLLRLEGLGTAGFHGSGPGIATTYAFDATVTAIGGRWHALVADAEGGLKVFDISGIEEADDEWKPPLVGSSFATEARAVATWAADGGVYALVADRREGLRVLDVSRPAAIRQLALVAAAGAMDATVALPPGRSPMAVVGTTEGLVVLDLAKPDAPVTLGRLTGHSVRRVAVLDPAAALYVAVTDRSVIAIDCSNPAKPRVTSTYETRFAEDVFVPESDSPRLYVAEGHRGVSVLEPRASGEMLRVSSCPTIFGVCVSGWRGTDGQSYLYALDTERLWQVQVLVPAWAVPAASP